jgi:hypothetical protein
MSAKGCHVLTFDWTNFGKSTDVAAAVQVLPAPSRAAAAVAALETTAAEDAAPASDAAAGDAAAVPARALTLTGAPQSRRDLWALVADDASVLEALADLGDDVGALLASLAPPDMADARLSCRQEAALSETEGSQSSSQSSSDEQGLVGSGSPKSVFDLTASPPKAR